MRVNFTTYDDGDIDLELIPDNNTETVLLHALAFRDADNLGVDETDDDKLTIRLQERVNEN